MSGLCPRPFGLRFLNRCAFLRGKLECQVQKCTTDRPVAALRQTEALTSVSFFFINLLLLFSFEEGKRRESNHKHGLSPIFFLATNQTELNEIISPTLILVAVFFKK